MKIALVHTDLRIYWPARLLQLTHVLKDNDMDLVIIEIAGKGSPYDFLENDNKNMVNWNILFPEEKIEKLNSVIISRKLKAKLSEINPDIVISGSIAFQSGAVSVNWANQYKKPIITFDDVRLEDVHRNFAVNFIKKCIYSTIDAVIVPDAKAWQETYFHWGFTKDQIFDGVDVVDNEFFFPANAKANNNIIPPKSILAVGRQVPKKNWVGLLDGWIDLAKRIPRHDYNLVYIGQGPDHETLKQKAGESQLQNIYFLPYQTQESLRNIFHTASALILPSKYGETWGLIINEAMAAGLPVLVSNACGCAGTLVKSGVNGYTFDPNEATNDIANTLQKFLALNKEEQQLMGKQSLEIIKDWGIPRFCKGYLDAINFVRVHPKNKFFVYKFFCRLWKGRYRPG
jgi:glycosyltransferase involved in cell wall biosynthesis